MITETTDRLICKTEMLFVDGLPMPLEAPALETVALWDIKPATGMEYGFMFYEKDTEKAVCHIMFENKRRTYEISYGTEPEFRGKGYMKEALDFFTKWIFDNTKTDALYALINNNETSQHILERNGFIFEKKDECGDWFVRNR